MLRTAQFTGLLLIVTLSACSSSAQTSGPTSSAPATSGPTSGVSTTIDVATTTTVVEPKPTVANIGTYGVGRRDKTYVDTSRATAENNDYKGADSRTLHTLTWYPSSTAKPGGETVDDGAIETTVGKFPLVILSHGVTGIAGVYGGTGMALASAGYVVVAPDYPLSNGAAPGGPITRDVINQPADATFVLEQVIADNSADFAGMIDSERIGAMGHSLGGFTTMGLTFAKCCADPTVDAAVILAGGSFGKDLAVQAQPTPVLFFHGDADGTVPYTTGQAAYAAAKAPKAFITIPGGAHVPPFRGSASDLADQYHKALVPWFDRWLKDSVNALDGMRSAVKNSLGRMTIEEQLR
jgi:dienelactone hydrolase